MTSYFVDTSALAKRYVREVGSGWMWQQSISTAGHNLFISELTVVELSSLLARQARMGILPQQNAQSLLTNFNYHIATQYLVRQIDMSVIQRAQGLVWKYPLRTLDSIQLASALEIRKLFPDEPIHFLSADNNLLTAAQGEGFLVDNPNNHP